jgi:hypothetical protein
MLVALWVGKVPAFTSIDVAMCRAWQLWRFEVVLVARFCGCLVCVFVPLDVDVACFAAPKPSRRRAAGNNWTDEAATVSSSVSRAALPAPVEPDDGDDVAARCAFVCCARAVELRSLELLLIKFVVSLWLNCSADAEESISTRTKVCRQLFRLRALPVACPLHHRG